MILNFLLAMSLMVGAALVVAGSSYLMLYWMASKAKKYDENSDQS
jgi:uncharacterized membrane protein HdeD (DUF308 family)